MMNMTIKAFAKLNLSLDIKEKLDNGYHIIETIFQSVSLYDTIKIQTGCKENEVFCDKGSIPSEDNICYKALIEFLKTANIKDNCKVEITKQIPLSAGLAGGSADAAAVIIALDNLLETNFSLAKLCEIGLSVGSDVPFCIVGGTCLSQNTGGVLSPLKPLKDCFVVIAKPEAGVSTSEAYEAADKTYIYKPDSMKMLDACAKGDFELICKYAGNVFEQVVEVPERVEFKRIMRGHGAVLAQMSGSGPAVFALFNDKKSAENCMADLNGICNNVFLTVPVSHGAKLI